MILEDREWNENRTRSKKSEKKARSFNLCIWRLGFFDDAHCMSLFNLSFKTKLETRAKIISVYNAYSPHDLLVYPPKIYFPTLIIVTVGPLPSHREWNVLAAQPSTDARQQRFQREFTPSATGASQLANEVKWFFLFPTITESSKPVTNEIWL